MNCLEVELQDVLDRLPLEYSIASASFRYRYVCIYTSRYIEETLTLNTHNTEFVKVCKKHLSHICGLWQQMRRQPPAA